MNPAASSSRSLSRLIHAKKTAKHRTYDTMQSTDETRERETDFHWLRKKNRREEAARQRGHPFLSFHIAQFDATGDDEKHSRNHQTE